MKEIDIIEQVLDLANRKLELSLKDSAAVHAAWEKIKETLSNPQ